MSHTTTAPPGWVYSATVGFATAIMGVLGYNVWICGGLLGGTMWTLYVAGFFMFMPPLGVIEVIAVGAATAWAVHRMAKMSAFRAHIALAILLAPLLGMGLAYGVARAVDARGTCSIGHFR